MPTGKAIHAIFDNYAVRKHPKVCEWLGRDPAALNLQRDHYIPARLRPEFRFEKE